MLLSRRQALAAAATALGASALAACNTGGPASATATATAPLATLGATPAWSVTAKGATVVDYHPRLGALLLTPATGKVVLRAVTPDGTGGWTVDVPTSDPSAVQAGWIAADGADCVAAWDEDSTALTVWQATSTKETVSAKASSVMLGATGLLAVTDDGVQTLTLTGGTTPHLTSLSAQGTPLAASTDGHYLTVNDDKTLCLDGAPLSDAGEGAPKAVTLTASVAAAAWDDTTVAWAVDGTRIAKVDQGFVADQRRPVTGGQWVAWGGAAWVYQGQSTTLDAPAAAILSDAAYENSDGTCTAVDLTGDATVASGKVQAVGAPVAADHLVTFDGSTLVSWPLRESATSASTQEA